MKLTACSRTDPGLVRRNNEDACFVSVADGLFIVADGMGGHAAGEVASDLAIRRVCAELLPRLPGGADAPAAGAALAAAVQAANREIAAAAAGNPAWQGMGTTLTILQLQAGQGTLVHVGDSRLYRWRKAQLEQLSDDQTLVAAQLRQGVINAAEAAESSLRHVLLQAVGTTEELDICTRTLELAEQDRFLLCSDGLTDLLGDGRIAALMAETGDLERLCDLLVDAAKAAGGRDNITVVVVEIEQL